MDIDVIPTLIDQYRETFEGEAEPGFCWITSGPRESALLGTIESLPADQAFAAPAPGARSIAGHVEHLRFALDLTLQRLRGENPPADWAASFNVGAASPEAWATLQRELRRAYEAVLAELQQQRNVPPQAWPPINLVGLAAMTAHNAYHLGAIRQIVRIVRPSR
jgi:uncharacterized damage-inducible protein DinB